MSSRRREVEVPAWQVPPMRTTRRPALVGAVAASERLRTGLAGEWHQRELSAERPVVAGADVLLVEVADGVVPGFAVADVEALLADAARHGVPVVVWATAGLPTAGTQPLVDAATAVFVADHVDEWRALVPTAQALPPAASPRVHRPGQPRTPRVAVVASGTTHPSLGGAVASVLGRGLAPLEDAVEVHRLDRTVPVRAALPTPLADRVVEPPRGASPYAAASAAVTGVAVLVDGTRRSPGDTWTVLEAAAAQTAIVSVGGTELPEGFHVPTPSDPAALRGEVVARLHQPELREREGLRLQRAVFAGHTYRQRVDEILASLPGSRDSRGVTSPTAGVAGSVSAIVPTNRLHEIDNVLANAGRQAHRDLELVLVLHGIQLDQAELRERAAAAGVPHLTVLPADSTLTLGACLNLGIDAAAGDWIAKLDDDNVYGEHYLTDLLNAAESSGAGVVGKWAHYVWLRSSGAVVLRYPEAEHTWQRRIQGGSMVFAGDVARELRFGDLPRAVDSDILDRSIEAGVKIWSADRFNYVSVRGDDRTAHTWTVADATFLTAAGRLAYYGDPRAHVEV